MHQPEKNLASAYVCSYRPRSLFCYSVGRASRRLLSRLSVRMVDVLTFSVVFLDMRKCGILVAFIRVSE